MTRLLLPLLLLLSLQLLSAQTSTTHSPAVPDARLYAAFDSAYLETLRRDNPTLLLRWNYYLDNAFVISDFPPQKGDIAQYPEVLIPDVANVNIFVLEKNQRLARDWNKATFYRIGSTDKVLIYYSGKDFNRKFRESLSKTK